MKYLPNTVKQKLNAKECVLGSWLNLPSLEVTEIMARGDFEFLVIDGEHGSMNYETMQKMVMVIEAHDCFPYIRVQDNHPVAVKRALETGCYGVIVPMINSLEDAQRAVESVYYPPRGKRGVGLSRAQGYGLEFERYKNWYLENVSVVLQIEHVKSIEQLEKILSLQEIDATMIGPYDLSASLGYPGQYDHPLVRDMIKKYETISQQCGVPMGFHIVQPDEKNLREKILNGYHMLAYGVDEIFVSIGCREAGKVIQELAPEFCVNPTKD